MLHITRDIGLQTDFVDAISKLLLHTSELVGSDRCTLFLVDKTVSPGFLYAGVPHVVSGAVAVSEIRVPISLHSIVGACALSGSVFAVPDAYSDPRFDLRFDRMTGYRTRSLLVAPIKDEQGVVIAVIQVSSVLSGIMALLPNDKSLLLVHRL